jgi:hypothetical protein
MLGDHQLTEKPSHFSSQREDSQKAQIEIKIHHQPLMIFIR